MLIFDMDGTLIDSNGIWRQVDEAFLAKRGYPYTREYYEGVAHTIFPMAAKFTKAYCHLEESEEEIMAEWMQMAGDAYAVRVPIKPGVREYLDRCRAAGERMIVLTSSVPEHCRAALGRLGLTEYFERGTYVDYGDRRQVFISGTASINNKGEVVCPGDIRKQTERMWENVEALLKEAGCTFDDLGQMIVYLRDVADYTVVKGMYDERFPDTPRVFVYAPVCRPGWLIEMECMGVRSLENKEFAPY